MAANGQCSLDIKCLPTTFNHTAFQLMIRSWMSITTVSSFFALNTKKPTWIQLYTSTANSIRITCKWTYTPISAFLGLVFRFKIMCLNQCELQLKRTGTDLLDILLGVSMHAHNLYRYYIYIKKIHMWIHSLYIKWIASNNIFIIIIMYL